MNQRTVFVLVGLGIVAIGGGWYFGTASTPTEQTSIDAGRLMFPGLAPKLRQAARIEVVFQGKPMAVVLKDGRWVLPDRGGYPINDAKLHTILAALTELRLVEPRTSDPAMLSRLGVEDPTKPGANSDLLRVLDANGKPIVEVIVGHHRIRTQGDVPEQVYVRRPNEPQAWLAEGALQIDHDPAQWFDRNVTNIDHAKIASVSVTRGDSKLVFTRQGDKLLLTDPADHPKLEDYKVEDVARAFEMLTFQDVRPATDPVGKTVGTSVFTTTDGMTITATVFQDGKNIWVSLAATGTGKAATEAAALSKRVTGWLYELGSWKEAALVPVLDDLKAAEKPTAEKPAAENPAAAGPAKP